MISGSVLSFLSIAAVFLLGMSVGQILLRIRLAKLERENLQLDQQRLAVLKNTLNARSIIIEHRVPARFEQEVRDEIDEILGNIENS